MRIMHFPDLSPEGQGTAVCSLKQVGATDAAQKKYHLECPVGAPIQR
jgi:hypothetical protein